FAGREASKGKWRWVWAALLVVTLSSLGALYFPQMKFYSGQILAGGVVGLVISKSLVKVFNFAGVAVILWTAVVAFTVFYTERPRKELLAWPLDTVASLKRRWNFSPLGNWFFLLREKLHSLKTLNPVP